MRILAIESSCDETAAAVIEGAGELQVAEREGESGRFWAIEGVKNGEAGATAVQEDEQQGQEQATRVGQEQGSAKAAEQGQGRTGNPRILSNVVVSQVDIFAAYGGVIPEVAARSHLEVILPVVQQALDEAGVTKEGIDAIAVTYAPGLLGSLLIGTLTARTLAILWQKPLLAVHHLKSHIYANWLKTGVALPSFPLLALVVSGGHTQIIAMRAHNEFEIIGTTRDDAVGECFDKVAKILGLPYPGGPSIAKCASGQSYTLPSETVAQSSSKESDVRQPENSLQTKRETNPAPNEYELPQADGIRAPIGDSQAYRLPHPQVEGLDFSFSGLKTAVLRAVQADLGLPITTPSFELAGKLSAQQRADFAASFQETAAEILVEKLQKALAERPDTKSIVLAGGVSANQALRERVEQTFGATQQVLVPELKLTGDNAAMVGAAAYYEILAGVPGVDPYTVDIAPRVPIG